MLIKNIKNKMILIYAYKELLMTAFYFSFVLKREVYVEKLTRNIPD